MLFFSTCRSAADIDYVHNINEFSCGMIGTLEHAHLPEADSLDIFAACVTALHLFIVFLFVSVLDFIGIRNMRLF